MNMTHGEWVGIIITIIAVPLSGVAAWFFAWLYFKQSKYEEIIANTRNKVLEYFTNSKSILGYHRDLNSHLLFIEKNIESFKKSLQDLLNLAYSSDNVTIKSLLEKIVADLRVHHNNVLMIGEEKLKNDEFNSKIVLDIKCSIVKIRIFFSFMITCVLKSEEKVNNPGQKIIRQLFDKKNYLTHKLHSQHHHKTRKKTEVKIKKIKLKIEKFYMKQVYHANNYFRNWKKHEEKNNTTMEEFMNLPRENLPDTTHHRDCKKALLKIAKKDFSLNVVLSDMEILQEIVKFDHVNMDEDEKTPLHLKWADHFNNLFLYKFFNYFQVENEFVCEQVLINNIFVNTIVHKGEHHLKWTSKYRWVNRRLHGK